MVVRILSLTSSSPACERNWSTFESGGDDYAEVVYRDDDDEMDSTEMRGSGIGEAMGGDEFLEPRRSARLRQLYEEEEFDSEEEEFDDEEEMHLEDENDYIDK
uniref:Uncharacterized protein n=1 Tax=Hordeum vulgare subsp. vulgare TaxID=112509 RepID=A0A8I7BEG0_HORVV